MEHVDNSIKSPLTAISIGPGIRGIERGVERVVGLIHLAYVEIEAFIIENLVAQMERGVLAPAVIWSDAKTLPCEPFRGITDILLAGYPCQPFSTAGKRKGTEDPRHLYPYIERAIRIIRPRICFFENVRGHVTCGLPEVIASLEGLGYRVHWGIYSAEETGAAHKRERVFILAMEYSELQSINTRLRWLWGKSDSTSSELAHPINNGQCNGCSEIPSAKAKIEGETHREKRDEEIWERMRNESQHCHAMANTNEQRFKEIRIDREPIEAQHLGIARSCVSRPGQPQQAWEHPRVISRKVESAVGLSAYGYHFREDILRALGNSVYEDTSEVAFQDLIRKHKLNLYDKE